MFNVNEMSTIPRSTLLPCRKVFTNTLLEIARTDRQVVALTSDARGSVTLDEFAKVLPQQFVETGIAEQNAVGIAAGLASCGHKVFVCGPACFYTSRALEQVKIDVAYTGYPVKIIGVSGGVAYGHLGSSHTCLHDIAVLRTFPNMHVVIPCDAKETEKLTRLLPDYAFPAYVRLGRNAVPDVYENDDFEFTIGKANKIRCGKDVSIIATGECVFHALKAAEMLAADGIEASVLNMHTLKPADTEAILAEARSTGRIITVEEHSIFGGLGAIVAEVVSQNCPVPVKIIGFPDENVIHAKPLDIFHHYGLDSQGIYQTTINFLKP